jgi:hypothetical protein
MKIPTLIPGLIPLLMALASGCASTSAVTPNDFVIQWQDKPKAELLRVLGPPRSIILLPGGESLLTWERVQRHPSGTGRMHNAQAYYTRCELVFKVDPAGMIQAEQETCS